MRTLVSIKGLQLYAHHGMEEEERSLGQRFMFDIRCRLAEVGSHHDDLLLRSVSYNALAKEIAAVSAATCFRTLEALAEAIARHLLAEHAVIEAVDVTAAKFSPPMPYLLNVASVEISLVRAEL